MIDQAGKDLKLNKGHRIVNVLVELEYFKILREELENENDGTRIDSIRLRFEWATEKYKWTKKNRRK